MKQIKFYIFNNFFSIILIGILLCASNFLNAQCMDIKGTATGAMAVTNNPLSALGNTPTLTTTTVGGGNANKIYQAPNGGLSWYCLFSQTHTASFNVVIKQGYKGRISNLILADYIAGNNALGYTLTNIPPSSTTNIRIQRNGVDIYNGATGPASYTTADYAFDGSKVETFTFTLATTAFRPNACDYKLDYSWILSNATASICIDSYQEFCSNLTNGGKIWGTQTGCAPLTAATLNSEITPSGGSTFPIQYIWLRSTTASTYTPATASQWQQIVGANMETYNPGAVNQTTWYIRCARRSGCTDYTGESNIAKINITGNCGGATCATEKELAVWNFNAPTNLTPASAVSTIEPLFKEGASALLGFPVGSTYLPTGGVPTNPAAWWTGTGGVQFNITTAKFEANSPMAIRFSLTVKQGYNGSLSCLKFDKLSVAPPVAPPPGTVRVGGDPCGVRILRNGVEVFQSYDYPLTTAWMNRAIPLMGSNFEFDGSKEENFSFEIMGYGTPAMITEGGWRWVIDNIAVCGCYAEGPRTCDNATNGGKIWGNQMGCAPYTAANLNNEILPTGGAAAFALEYIWLKSTTSNSYTTTTASQWQQIIGANNDTYNPGVVNQTTWYIRCARRKGCTDYTGESNVIKITINDNCGSACPTPKDLITWNLNLSTSFSTSTGLASSAESIILGGTNNKVVLPTGGTFFNDFRNVNGGFAHLPLRETKFAPNSPNAVKFSITIKKGTIGNLSALKFDKRSVQVNPPPIATPGADPCGVRILRNGVEVFQSYDYPLITTWMSRNIALGGSNFAFDGSRDEVFTFEILGYGTAAMVAASNWFWDLDNIKVCGCYSSASSIGDCVFDDRNGNGILEAGEAGVPNIQVFLSGTVNKTTTTDDNGKYIFTDLPAGTYCVLFNLPSQYRFTKKDAGTNDNIDSDVEPSTNKTANITLGAGENNLSIDAGVYKVACIGDFVFNDINKNGIQELGEQGVPNTTLILSGTTSAGQIINNVSTTTDAAGKYKFYNLAPGSYQVVIYAPTGFIVSPSKAMGSNNTNDSDFDPSTNRSGFVTITSGQNYLDLDAGIYNKFNTCSNDVTPPVLSNVPQNVTVECNAIPTTNPSATDNCTVTVIITKTEFIENKLCANKYRIRRTWTAKDAAGNSKQATQLIVVTDTKAPAIINTPLKDTVITCGQAIPLPPSNVKAIDNCDANPTLSFSEIFYQGTCNGKSRVMCQWVAKDACGNQSVKRWNIFIIEPMENRVASNSSKLIEKEQALSPVEINSNNTQSNEATFYPNPTNGEVTINFNGLKVNKIIVIDALGQVIQSIENDFHETVKLSLEGKNTGVYHIQLFTNNGISSKKVLKLE